MAESEFSLREQFANRGKKFKRPVGSHEHAQEWGSDGGYKVMGISLIIYNKGKDESDSTHL